MEPKILSQAVDGKIVIPWTVCESVGYDEKTVLYMNLHNYGEPKPGKEPLDLLITPFLRMLWEDLWCIRIKLQNRRGTMHAALQILENACLDVKSCVATDSIAGTTGLLEAVVCCRLDTKNGRKQGLYSLKELDDLFIAAIEINQWMHNCIRPVDDSTYKPIPELDSEKDVEYSDIKLVNFFKDNIADRQRRGEEERKNGTFRGGRYVQGGWCYSTDEYKKLEQFASRLESDVQCKLEKEVEDKETGQTYAYSIRIPDRVKRRIRDYYEFPTSLSGSDPTEEGLLAISVDNCVRSLNVNFLNPKETISRIVIKTDDSPGVLRKISGCLAKLGVNQRIVKTRFMEAGESITLDLVCDISETGYDRNTLTFDSNKIKQGLESDFIKNKIRSDCFTVMSVEKAVSDFKKVKVKKGKLEEDSSKKALSAKRKSPESGAIDIRNLHDSTVIIAKEIKKEEHQYNVAELNTHIKMISNGKYKRVEDLYEHSRALVSAFEHLARHQDVIDRLQDSQLVEIQRQLSELKEQMSKVISKAEDERELQQHMKDLVAHIGRPITKDELKVLLPIFPGLFYQKTIDIQRLLAKLDDLSLKAYMKCLDALKRIAELLSKDNE